MSKAGPSILYASPMCSLDMTSGAAISMHALLASLATRGYRAVALEAQLFDCEEGGERVAQATRDADLQTHEVLHTTVHGVEHFMVRTRSSRRLEMTSREEELFLQRLRHELLRNRPDMVILSGDLMLEGVVMHEARLLKIPVVFYLAHGGYERRETFRDVSVVVTDTQATADLYKKRLGLDCKPVGKFIDAARFKAPQRRPEFITFINPEFEKGVHVFMALALLASREAPELKFLVVQSRGRWEAALAVLAHSPADFPNVKVIGHQLDMRPVYAVTQVLLVPSVWHESGGRVVVEALVNGIPVLASRCGGPPELAGEAGVIFDLPGDVTTQRNERAPEAVVRPWLEELRRIFGDSAYYEELVSRANRQALKHDVRHSTDRFLAAVMPTADLPAA
ncbi:glycosyltransferase family 4 protein [Caenimonas sp. SL110]|uniref:glycosyltransferase family 4 protein n=1 Tax=Caenimonas sp. SL110 TaxID=1450524 RepID=UPI00069E1BB4|nr:glycosyltransferase family 4 protein [Caenimonas sp. SL110]